MISKLLTPTAVRRLVSLPSQWALERGIRRRTVRADAPRYLIVPADPWTLTGSKGDEAMIRAVVNYAQQARPDAPIAILTSTPAADEAARSMGLLPLRAWSDRWRLSEVMDAVEKFAPSAMFFMGADIMDGYYGVVTSARPLLIADCAVRAGIACTFLGFSFNSSPRRSLRFIYNQLHRDVTLNLRDRTSLRRFQGFTKARAELVADSAFLLAPDETTSAAREAKRWADSQRSAGKIVLGLNVHPMLLREATAGRVAQLAAEIAEQTLQFLSAHPQVALLLLGHDDRPETADTRCLRPIAEALRPKLGAALHYSGVTPGAAEAKACIAVVDGVVTGRMHLAIAALGSGVPVMALTYQDKFQGLFEHFGLPSRYLLPPEQISKAGGLASMMAQFVGELPQLKGLVTSTLPNVRALALRNVRPCTVDARALQTAGSSSVVHGS